MKPLLLCILFSLFAVLAKAQSNTASLNITITDVQSVTFSSIESGEALGKQTTAKNGSLKVLSNTTSQITRISSKNSQYERLYKEFYSAASSVLASNSNNSKLAVNRTSSAKSPRISNLVIYQIDPR